MRNFAKLLGLMCLVVALLVTGCTPTENGGQSEKRDSINLTINTPLQSIDGHGIRNLQDMLVRAQMYEGLYYFDEAESKIEPRLAEDHTVSEDGTVYTFNLRQGVKFHNGDELKASDVVFSLNRAIEAPTLTNYTAPIASAKEVDEHTVEVTLKAPSAPFITLLTEIYIMSEREITE